MLPLRARVDLGAMASKGYSVFLKLMHYWSLIILFSVVFRTFVGGILPLCRDSFGIFKDAEANWTRKG